MFCDNWLNFEGIMLSELNQTEKTNSAWYHLYEES